MTDPAEAMDGVLSNLDFAVQKLANLIHEQGRGNVPESIRLIANEVGLKHVACLKFSCKMSEDVTLLSAMVTYSKDWQTRYFLKRYHLVDPIVAYGRVATQPFDWKQLRDLSSEVAAFFIDSTRHGVGANGITFPIRNRVNGFSLVSLTSDLTDPMWDAWHKENLTKLELFALLVDSAAGISTKLPSDEVRLSKREEEALIWAARGKTAHETADIMDVAYGSVR